MSEFRNQYKLPEDIAAKIRKEAAAAAKKKKDITAEFDAYSGFVESQKGYFLEDVNTILNILTELIMDGKLFIDTKLMARIKDAESAVYNDGDLNFDKEILMNAILTRLEDDDYTILPLEKQGQTKPKNKVLDDVFGITIITDTEEELDILRKELKKQFDIKNEKRKDKVQYHAIHMEMVGNDDNLSPLVECQLKTRQSYIDSYDHTLYKVESILARKLYSENEEEGYRKVRLTQSGAKKVEETIQQFYDKGGFSIFRNIPRMWEATFSEEDEEMKLKRLSEGQTLKRVYPSLVIRPERIK